MSTSKASDGSKHTIQRYNDDSSNNPSGLPDSKYYKDACMVTGFSQHRLGPRNNVPYANQGSYSDGNAPNDYVTTTNTRNLYGVVTLDTPDGGTKDAYMGSYNIYDYFDPVCKRRVCSNPTDIFSQIVLEG